jgi:hypothetical protein
MTMKTRAHVAAAIVLGGLIMAGAFVAQASPATGVDLTGSWRRPSDGGTFTFAADGALGQNAYLLYPSEGTYEVTSGSRLVMTGARRFGGNPVTVDTAVHTNGHELAIDPFTSADHVGAIGVWVQTEIHSVRLDDGSLESSRFTRLLRLDADGTGELYVTGGGYVGDDHASATWALGDGDRVDLSFEDPATGNVNHFVYRLIDGQALTEESEVFERVAPSSTP